MDVDQIKELAERAKSDPAFFHALVYDPDQVISQVPGLDRETRAQMLAIDAETLVERLLLRGGCGITCGDDSCERTCGMRSCGVTCASSCSGSTCGGRSCGQTTFVADPGAVAA
jgi:hypothetical protein